MTFPAPFWFQKPSTSLLPTFGVRLTSGPSHGGVKWVRSIEAVGEGEGGSGAGAPIPPPTLIPNRWRDQYRFVAGLPGRAHEKVEILRDIGHWQRDVRDMPQRTNSPPFFLLNNVNLQLPSDGLRLPSVPLSGPSITRPLPPTAVGCTSSAVQSCASLLRWGAGRPDSFQFKTVLTCRQRGRGREGRRAGGRPLEERQSTAEQQQSATVLRASSRTAGQLHRRCFHNRRVRRAKRAERPAPFVFHVRPGGGGPFSRLELR